ncbi:unnamed protein product [Diatraea saccharalis]|uniref:C2H2-type domain-containing protein n=1 Tax=Diatraea saccharalis TaxID=40085 RepID=A0A9N9R655_9NEOP|nr:unnamed protein product [Diatraea saccharalis]
MDMLKNILDPNKLKLSCFLCFKSCGNMSSLFQDYVISIEYKTIEIKLKDIIYSLFPSHIILSEQACMDCISLLIEIFIVLQKNSLKRKILTEVTKTLIQEINTRPSNGRLFINLKLPEYEDVRLKTETVTNKKVVAHEDVTEQEKEYISTPLCQLINCKICTMKFPSKNVLKAHIKLAHETANKSAICEICGKDCIKSSTLKAHLNSHKEGVCPHCSKVLKTHPHFKLHIKSHDPNFKIKRQRPKVYYNCDLCSFKSLNKQSLQGHINKMHLRIRPHICDICNKGFYRKSNLVEHVATHGEGKSMTCEHCGLKFLYKKTLLEHLRLHSGDKPFPCDVCKERFVTSGRRTEHFKRKHMEKNVPCYLCDKKFSLNSEVNVHLKKYHGVVNK